jgi:hypothetical protein
VEVGGLVLAVAVHLSRDVVAVRERVLEARLDGAPDSEVEGMAKDRRPPRLRLGGGCVGGAVVDDQDVESGGVALDVAHHPADHPGLVVGGDDRQLAQLLGDGGAHRDPGQDTAL